MHACKKKFCSACKVMMAGGKKKKEEKGENLPSMEASAIRRRFG
jgi:ferredoxin